MSFKFKRKAMRSFPVPPKEPVLYPPQKKRALDVSGSPSPVPSPSKAFLAPVFSTSGEEQVENEKSEEYPKFTDSSEPEEVKKPILITIEDSDEDQGRQPSDEDEEEEEEEEEPVEEKEEEEHIDENDENETEYEESEEEEKVEQPQPVIINQFNNSVAPEIPNEVHQTIRRSVSSLNIDYTRPLFITPDGFRSIDRLLGAMAKEYTHCFSKTYLLNRFREILWDELFDKFPPNFTLALRQDTPVHIIQEIPHIPKLNEKVGKLVIHVLSGELTKAGLKAWPELYFLKNLKTLRFDSQNISLHSFFREMRPQKCSIETIHFRKSNKRRISANNIHPCEWDFMWWRIRFGFVRILQDYTDRTDFYLNCFFSAVYIDKFLYSYYPLTKQQAAGINPDAILSNVSIMKHLVVYDRRCLAKVLECKYVTCTNYIPEPYKI